MILTILGVVFLIASVVCSIIILIDAFNNELWKGVLGLFCGLYLLYYALVEFEHGNKWLIVAISLLGGVIGGGLIGAGAAASIPRTQ